MDLRKALLLCYITLLIVFWSAAGAFGQTPSSKAQEDRLAAEAFYDIPHGIPVMAWFEHLIAVVKEDMIRFPEHGTARQLILGDAYHWLGHIYEDRHDWHKALEMHNKSHEHYLLSDFKYSPMILNYYGVEHALYHLAVVSIQLRQPMPFGTRKEGVSEQGEPEIGSRIAYKKKLQEIVQRSNLPLPEVFCGAMFR